MAISSNSIFHYTTKMAILKKILLGEFFPSYCLEGEDIAKTYIPMVSFCDIPLDQMKEHFKYGEYGVGLTQSWAIKSDLHPVHYFLKDGISLLRKRGVEQKELIAKLAKKEFELLRDQDFENYKKFEIESKPLLDFDILNSCYQKQYKGILYRKGKEIDKKYKFYNDREWRFVPDLSKQKQFPRFILEKDFSKFKLNNPSKPHIKTDGLTLKFDADDIKYILVKKNSEIPLIIKYLKMKKSLFTSSDQEYLLYSKIISCEQIVEDF